jgi:ABC-2 type transport system ATP-binding protein
VHKDRLPDTAVEIVGLQKTYGAGRGRPGKQALKGVSLTIPTASIFGLLGPNGAGKSTLINILAGLVRKSGGSARVCGIDIDEHPRAARRFIGVVPQELSLDPYFPARAALELQAGLFGIPKAARRTDDLLAAMGLADKASDPARSLSGGMRRRLMIAKALVHSPPVLILDEPTAGVDVELRQQLWDYVRHLNRSGTTVVLTTHYLHEAEELCERIAVLVDGLIIASDTTEGLLRRLKDKVLEVEIDTRLASMPPGLASFAPTMSGPHRITIRYGHDRETVERFLHAVQAAGLRIVDVRTSQPDLEDVFLSLISAKDRTGR